MAESDQRVKRTLRLDPAVDDLLVAACRGRSINAWVADAIVVRLGSWEHPVDKITAKRKAGGRSLAPVFDPEKFSPWGFPLGQFDVAKPRAEVFQANQAGGKDGVRRFVRERWMWAGHDPDDYSEAMLAETLRMLAESKGGSA